MNGDTFAFVARSVGIAAERTIAAGARGTVAAVFQRSFYLRSSDGSFACVGPPGIGDGPLNVLLELPAGMDWAASGLTTQALWSRLGDHLRVASRFSIDLRSAEGWRPIEPPVPAGSHHVAAARLADAAATARGLGRLIVAELVEPPPEDIALFRAVRPGLAALRAFLAAPCPAPDPAMLDLVGLGPGLTPAGDDVLGGAMIACRAIGHPEIADLLAATVLPAAHARTSPISLAHLACAAEGFGASAIHRLIATLLSIDGAGLDDVVASVDAIGHSSGWDAALGVALVLQASDASDARCP